MSETQNTNNTNIKFTWKALLHLILHGLIASGLFAVYGMVVTAMLTPMLSNYFLWSTTTCVFFFSYLGLFMLIEDKFLNKVLKYSDNTKVTKREVIEVIGNCILLALFIGTFTSFVVRPLAQSGVNIYIEFGVVLFEAILTLVLAFALYKSPLAKAVRSTLEASRNTASK